MHLSRLGLSSCFGLFSSCLRLGQLPLAEGWWSDALGLQGHQGVLLADVSHGPQGLLQLPLRIALHASAQLTRRVRPQKGQVCTLSRTSAAASMLERRQVQHTAHPTSPHIPGQLPILTRPQQMRQESHR